MTARRQALTLYLAALQNPTRALLCALLDSMIEADAPEIEIERARVWLAADCFAGNHEDYYTVAMSHYFAPIQREG